MNKKFAFLAWIVIPIWDLIFKIKDASKIIPSDVDQ